MGRGVFGRSPARRSLTKCGAPHGAAAALPVAVAAMVAAAAGAMGAAAPAGWHPSRGALLGWAAAVAAGAGCALQSGRSGGGG